MLLVCLVKQNRFQNFANASSVKKWRSVATRGDPHLLPKWKASPAWKESASLGGIKYISKIAVDIAIPAQDLPAIGGTWITVCTGPRRLNAANGRLMVFRSMSQLNNCAPHDWEHLCDLIYIIGLGVPVVVASTWRIAGGDPAKLPAKGVAMHAAAAFAKPCTFVLTRAFTETNKELHAALWHCSQRPQSKWKVALDKGLAVGPNEVKASTISALAAVVLKLKRLDAGAAGRCFALGMH